MAQVGTPSLVSDNGRRIVKLNKAKFTDMGPLSRDSRFKVPTHTSDKGTNSLFGWLAEKQVKRWPSGDEIEKLAEEGDFKSSRKLECWSGCAKENLPPHRERIQNVFQ